MKFRLFLLSLFVVQLIESPPSFAQRVIPGDDQRLLYEIYKELVEYKTTGSEQNNTIAVEGMAAWLQAAGFPAQNIFTLFKQIQTVGLLLKWRFHYRNHGNR